MWNLGTLLVFSLTNNHYLGSKWASHNTPKPHAFTSPLLESNIFTSIVNTILFRVRKDLQRIIVNYISNILIAKYKDLKILIMLHNVVIKLRTMHTLFLSMIQLLLSMVKTVVKIKYPLAYNIYIVLQHEYTHIVMGSLQPAHIHFFFFVGFYFNNADYFYWVLAMTLSARLKNYIIISGINDKYPIWSRVLLYILSIVYLLSLTVCIHYMVDSIILPFFNKLIIGLKNVFNGILKMVGSDVNNVNTGVSGSNNPSPNPGQGSNIGLSKSEGKKSKKDNKENFSYESNYDNFHDSVHKLNEYKKYTNKTFRMPQILADYREYLPEQDKIELNNLLNKPSHKVRWNEQTTVKEFWEKKKVIHTSNWKDTEDIINIFYKNSKRIQVEHLGGKTSEKSKLFKKQLKNLYDNSQYDYTSKKSIILEQIKRKDGFEEQLRSVQSSVFKTLTDTFK